MVYKSVTAAMHNWYFVVLVIWNVLLNFGINYGLEYATLTNWGKLDMAHLSVFRIIHLPKSFTYTSLTFDIMGSSFLVAYFTCLLGPGGAINEVKKGKLQKLDAAALNRGIWRYLPVRSKSICARSFALGFLFMLVWSPPTILAWWLAIGDGTVYGGDYCWFKSVWCPVMAFFVYTIAHMSATSTDKFPADEEGDKGATEHSALLPGSKSPTGIQVPVGSAATFVSPRTASGGPPPVVASVVSGLPPADVAV